MTYSKVSGSRTLRKGSKKSSKHGSKKKGAMDFSSILNEMDDNMPMQSQGNMMPAQDMTMPGMQPNMMPGMQGMPGMQSNMMPMMDMNQMAMPQMGMPQMGMPQMGMPQMMTGSNPNNVDPLHLQHFVPQNENMNINNYGVNANQLMSGEQMSQQFNGRQSAPAVQMGGSIGSIMDRFYRTF